MNPAGMRGLAAVAAAVSLALTPVAALAQRVDDKAAKLYEDALVRYEGNDAAGASRATPLRPGRGKSWQVHNV